MLAFRSIQQGNHGVCEEFLYELKATMESVRSFSTNSSRPAGGRLRRPSSAGAYPPGTGDGPYPQVPKSKRNSLPLGLTCSTALTLSTVPPPWLTIWNLSVEVAWKPPVLALKVAPNQMAPASE
jgi:hypothetical protein